MRLLLIEDHARLGELVFAGLGAEGFVVDWARSLTEAFEARDGSAYDLILLDLGLPDGDGLDLVRRLRRVRDDTPILILTARGGLGDRIVGLDLGADDYLVKPFEMGELMARCRALLRRPGACLGVVLEWGNVALDTAGHALTIAGVTVALAPREFALLESLMRRAGQVVSRSSLEQQLYSLDAEVTPNALEVSVSRLRRRLVAARADIALKTAHGVGYALVRGAPERGAHG